MRSLLAILLFFAWGAGSAAGQLPSLDIQPARGPLYPAPTAALAADSMRGDNAYMRSIAEWTRQDDAFTAPFTVPFAWANRQVLLRIESASSDYDVQVNGRTVAYVADGNTPAEINITRAAREGRNEVTVRLHDTPALRRIESWKSGSEQPAVGAATVMSQPTLRVRDVLTRTWRAADESDYTAEVAVVVKSEALNPRTSRLWYELLSPAGVVAATGHRDVTLDMRREDTVRFLAYLPADSLWSAEHPHRYTLRLKTQHEGRYDEYTEFRLGLRSAELRDGELHVNGAPVTLRPAPLTGRATAEQLAAARQAGSNAVVLAPGIVPEEFYTMCDTVGIYVVAAAPVDGRNGGDSRRIDGAPANDPAWKEAFAERALRSYHAVKRHPSVVAFLLARNAANGICLYESYLALKREEESRPFVYPEAAGEWNSDPLKIE